MRSAEEQAIYFAGWYERNKDSKQEYARNTYNDRKKAIILYKESNPCMDCGVSYPYYVMHLDHREGEVKFKNISRMTTYSQAKILAELAKCDLVCSNCHAIRTFNRSVANKANG